MKWCSLAGEEWGIRSVNGILNRTLRQHKGSHLRLVLDSKFVNVAVEGADEAISLSSVSRTEKRKK